MKFIKAILLLPMALVYLSACGGAVEGDGTTSSTSGFNFVKGDPTTSVSKVCSVTAEFDGPVLATTVNDQSFSITALNATNPLSPSNGTWGLSPSSPTIAIFTPSINLVGSYIVRLTTAITNTNGVNLSQNESFTFTAQLPCTP